MMSLDNALWLAGSLTEATLLVLFFTRRTWRTFPVLCIYIAADLISNAANFIVLRSFNRNYFSIYLVETVVDSVLQFGVLVELTWSVLRPLRPSVPRRTLVAIALVIIGLGIAGWPVSGLHRPAQITTGGYLLAHLQQTFSILRVLMFLLVAAFSQLLSIGWRDRELQVATGLGFYSLVSLGAAMLRTHVTTVFQYSHLNEIVVASYVCSLIYWVVCFAQKEATRREFTPQMESFLLAMAGSARTQRIALADSQHSRRGNH